MKIPLANPARELNKIKNFESKFNKKLKNGLYVGGKDVLTFEENVANYIGSKYCVAVNSGTDALMSSLWGCNIKKKDEVITSPLSFVATANSIRHAEAEPLFIDIDSTNFNIDVDCLDAFINNKCHYKNGHLYYKDYKKFGYDLSKVTNFTFLRNLTYIFSFENYSKSRVPFNLNFIIKLNIFCYKVFMPLLP